MPHISRPAFVLGPDGILPVDLISAKKKVVAPLANGPVPGGDYGVIVYNDEAASRTARMMDAPRTFKAAYRKANHALHGWMPPGKPSKAPQNFVTDDVVVFSGTPAKIDMSKGVYIFPSHLDSSTLSDLDLPRFPLSAEKQQFLVVQVKNVEVEEAAAPGQESVASDEKLSPDTVEWRRNFIAEVPCLTAAQVAEQSTSKASNKSALASRWQEEGKIFSVKFESRNWFPKFQFHGGSPVPVIAKVIKTLPEHIAGWDLAFFFSNPNPYIGGRRPLELVRSNPDRVLSLAERFAHPADVF